MKKPKILFALQFATLVAIGQTTTLANFDFNGSTSYPVAASATASGITASINGTQANAAYSGAATGTVAFVQNTTAGNALSMASSSGNNTAYWTLTLGGNSLSAYQAYKIYLQSEHSSTGANAITISYGTNGTTFTALSQTVSPGLNTTFTEAIVDLSSITALNGASSVYIRFSASGASGTGTLRIDNLEIQGSTASGTNPWTVNGSDVGFLGKVGIGTSSPAYPLDVMGAARVTGGLTVGGTTTTSDLVINGPITLNNYTAAINPCFQLSILDANNHLAALSASAALQIDAMADQNPCPSAPVIPFVWQTNGNHVASSNRWIGTIENFDFNVRTSNIYRMSVKNNGDIGLGSFGGNNFNNGGAKFQFLINSGGDINIGATATNTVYAMTVKADGNVGIGTLLANNPYKYKLAVNGTIGCKEVKVEITSATWSDFVFKPDYKLMPLSKVEAFVKANLHLPNVPGNADVDANNGVNLAQMESTLLEKVEELTLYLIEQNKKVELLEKEVAKLKHK